MNNFTKTLSIGIPAYNEEKNIVNLIKSILNQKLKHVKIREIIVISDGSTDKTVEKVIEIKNEKVKLIQGEKREGKSTRLNQLFSIFQADFLLLLDADIVISDENLIEKLMSRIDDKRFGVACIKVTTLPARNLFERILNFSVEFLTEIELKWNKGDNYLAFKGVFLLLSKNLARIVKMPEDLINNDGYIYFYAKKKGFYSKYFGDLNISYQSPNSFTEHLSQSSRFQHSKNELSKYFSDTLIKGYKFPKILVLLILIKYAFKNPIYFMSYSLIAVLTRIYTLDQKDNLWHMSSSTKNISVSLQEGNIDISEFLEIYKKNVFKIAVSIRRLMYFTLYYYDKYILHSKTKIFILCYHSINNDNWRFSIDYAVFIKQLEYLRKNYEFISIEDLDKYINGKIKISRPSVLITFDDGYKDLVNITKDLKKMKISPALFLLSDLNHVNRKELDTNRDFLSKKDVLNLVKNGWTICSHGATHSDFLTLNNEQLKSEIIASKKILEKEFSKKILYFAYPRGRYTNYAKSLVFKAGYSLGFSMDDGLINPDDKKFTIPRIGVDRTHTISEFKTIFSPTVIKVRGLLKRSGVLI